MFKKLRNKFLLINMVTIVVVLVVSFLSIFFITFNNVKNEVSAQLDKTLEQRGIYDDFPKEEFDKENDVLVMKDNISNPPSISFWALLDESNQLVEIHNNNFTFDEDFYECLLEKYIASDNTFDYFKVDEQYWAFKVIEVGDYYKIAFSDVTSNSSVLFSFFYAFLIVSFITIILVYVICFNFANKAIEPIKDSFEKQKRFVSDASHELKTPLTVINANVDFVLSNSSDTIQQQRKWLVYIKDEVTRMSKLTNDLLALAKFDHQDDTILFEKIHLSSILETTVLSLEATIFESNLKVDYDIKEDLYILGDRDKIKQLCLILLDNAIKYNKKDGSIYVKAFIRNNKEIVLTVENTGEKIDKEDLSKLFNRFYRIDKSRNRQTGGYGIGLSIAKMITDKHHAKITVSNNDEGITSFIVIFPYKSNS